MELSIGFIFEGIIKINFTNKLAQTLVSFVSTKCVLGNDAIGWSVLLKINQ